MDRTKRTIRILHKSLVNIDKLQKLYKAKEDDQSYIIVHRLAAQENTVKWVLRMLEEGDFSE